MAAQTKTTKAATKAPAKKAATKKAGSGSASAAKKAPAKKAAAKSATTKAPAKSGAKKPVKKTSAKATPAKKAPAKKAPATKAPAKKTAAAEDMPKSTLSPADVKEFTALITEELTRVRQEYTDSMAVLDELKTAGQDSAGDDPADAGAKTFEREQEMSIANNRLDLIAQMERALGRIEAGTYGVCESCGQMIPKARLQAFPQATLCVECKAREERR